MRTATLSLFAALIVTGCLGAVNPGAQLDRDSAALLPPFTGAPLVQEHDHSDPAAHALSYGLSKVGHHSAFAESVWPAKAGSINELAVKPPYVYVSRSAPQGGFAILNVSDPANPVLEGEFLSEGGSDIEVSEDGNWVFLASQRTVPDPAQLAGAPLQHAPRGVYIVDVSDKANPRMERFFPLPVNGPHTNFYYKMGDRQLLVLCTYDLVANPTSSDLVMSNPATQRVLITEIVQGPLGWDLKVLSTYQVTSGAGLILPHDATVQKHPITGQELMYVAYWDAGLRIVDITDPSKPKEIGSFLDFAPSAYKNLHDAKAFPMLVEGRHITAVAPELVTAPEAGQITFLDTTDPTKPVKLGHWSLPGDMQTTTPFLFSPHNFDIAEDGTLAYAHYHAGVWLLDVGTLANLQSPPVLGFYLPHEKREGYTGSVPNVWGVFQRDGKIWASDIGTGLYVLERSTEVALPAEVA